jgi:diacylglycerol O-acyltransferase / wax synthase
LQAFGQRNSFVPKRLTPLSGLDAGFLYLEDSGTPMHVGGLMLLDASKRRGADFHRDLIVHVGARLPQAAALKRVLHFAPLDLGHPLWTELTEIDLRAHILKRTLPAPGTQAQLLRLVERLHAIALPREIPLWQFVVIQGLESGQVALYSKIHHALLDGQGAIALAQALLDVEPKPGARRATPDFSPAGLPPAPSARDLASTAIGATVRQFASLLRGLPATLSLAGAALRNVREIGGRLRDAVLLAPRSPFNAQVGHARRFAVASLDIEQVKRVAKGFAVSLNDVVLALCASSLRDYLLRRRQLPKKSLVAAMPISLRARGDAAANNQVSMAQCALATDIADPVERLRAIATLTSQIKHQVATFRDLIPTDFPGLAAPLWASGLSRLWARGRIAERLPPLANLIISNVPGPPIDLYLAGAHLRHNYPVSAIAHGLALNITVQSYSGHLDFGLVASRDAVPRLEPLAIGLQHALDQLTSRLP